MADTFASLAQLRREGSVCTAGPGVHLVVRHAEAAAVLRDWQTFSSSIASTPTSQPLLSQLDSQHHARVRRLLLLAGVARESVRVARPQIRRIWSDLAAQVAVADRVDLVAEFTRPGVRAALGEIVGIPAGDRESVYAWVADLRADASDSPPGAGGTSSRGSATLFSAYVLEQARLRRQHDEQRADLFTRLLSVRDSLGSRLSDGELVMLMRLLCQAGIGSTSRAIGNLLYEVIRVPERYRRLRDARSVASTAVEESLRHDPPGHLVQRVCTKDTRLGGIAIKRGEFVVVNLASANRDEGVFVAPDGFDAQRPLLAEHLSFGRGRHSCVGARLARVIVEAALVALVDRIPESPRFVAGFTYQPETFGAWGPRRLDVDIPRVGIPI